MRPIYSLLFAAGLGAACSRGRPSVERDRAATLAAASPSAGTSAGAPFTSGQRTFEAAKKTLLRRYDATSLSDDELYRAAAEGLLARVDPSRARWNELLTPWQLDNVRREHGDEVAGFGLHYKLEAGVGMVVRGVVPGSTAELGGIHASDIVVRIDGHVLKDVTEEQLAEFFRGPAGSVSELAVLRDAEILAFRLVRALVSFDDVRAVPLAERVGYLRIGGFAVKTAAKVRTALEGLAGGPPVDALVVDLRDNAGGSFDGATATVGAMLPAGTPVAQVTARDGVQRVTAEGGAPLAGARFVLLVDHDTAAGAELFAADLREARGARMVGARTFGKWNVQNVERLQNGWGIKYTAAHFTSGAGKSFEGLGMAPDVELPPLEDDALSKTFSAADPAARLTADAPLRAALEIARAR